VAELSGSRRTLGPTAIQRGTRCGSTNATKSSEVPVISGAREADPTRLMNKSDLKN